MDLNYTLVGNSKHTMWARRYEEEIYRKWLVELIRSCHVCLVTVRPAFYAGSTLDRIAAQTGWQPAEHHFNEDGVDAATWKTKVLTERILPRFPASQIFAVESNAKVHRVYDAHGVAWAKVEGQEIWPALT